MTAHARAVLRTTPFLALLLTASLAHAQQATETTQAPSPSAPSPAAAPAATPAAAPAEAAPPTAATDPAAAPADPKGPAATIAPPPSSPPLTTTAATPPPAEAKPPSWLDRFKIAGGAILWYYQPLDSAGANNVDLFYANVIIDGKAGNFGLHVEPRFRGTKLRPFFDGPTWIEEAYVYGKAGPVTIKTGKVYKQLGLFWDDSFYGSVLVYDGLKLSPDYGISAEGEYATDQRAGLRYYGQFFVVDGRTNVSLVGRDTISIPGAKRRNETVARVEPFIKFRDNGIVKVGLSAEYLQADLPEGKNNVFHVGADATVRVGPFGAWAEYLRQNGKSVNGFPIAPAPATDTMPEVPGEASGRNNYVLTGASYTVGPVTGRYNVSWGQYADLDISETLHQPAVGWTVSPNLTLLAELVRWRRKAPTGSSVVDDSLNVTVNGHF